MKLTFNLYELPLTKEERVAIHSILRDKLHTTAGTIGIQVKDKNGQMTRVSTPLYNSEPSIALLNSSILNKNA